MSHIVRMAHWLLFVPLLGSLVVLPGLTAEAFAQTPVPAGVEGEPNNRLSQATLVAVPTQVQGRIDPVGDVDWYAFSVPQDGEVQISVTHAAENLVIEFEVFNPDASPMTGWIAPAEKGADTVATLDLPEAGRYYMQVADDFGDASSPQPYTLAITFTPAVDAGEPNKRLSNATPLELDAPRSATIFPQGDADWYAFSVPQDGQLQISVTHAAENLVIEFEVFNPDASPMTGWIAPAEKGADTVATLDLPEAGRYYMQVADDYSDARSLQPYSVAIAFTPAVDAGEPNNRFSNATPLELNVARAAAIFPKGDVDMYQLQATGPGKLQIAVTDVPADLDINMQVFNPDMWPISGWLGPAQKGRNATASVDLPEAGRYYVQVVDDYHDACSVQPYTITATFTP